MFIILLILFSYESLFIYVCMYSSLIFIFFSVSLSLQIDNNDKLNKKLLVFITSYMTLNSEGKSIYFDNR